MSEAKVTIATDTAAIASHMTSSAPSAPAGPSYGAGALGLGVDVGVLPMPEPTVEHAQSRDAFARETAPKKEHTSRDDGNTRRVDDNPFDKMARKNAQQLPRRVAQASKDLDHELDLGFDVLAKLAAAEKKLACRFGDRFNKLRQGSMLLTSDSQALRQKKLPLDNRALHRLAQLIADKGAKVNKEEIDAHLKLQNRFLAGTKLSVQALVQRVLRESYQLQNQMLWEYAERVRRLNKQKKLIREELLEPARQTKSIWASLQSQLGGDETFRADEPFYWRELDDNGEIVTLTLSKDDAAYYQSGAADNASGGSSSSFLQQQLQILNGPSRLTREDIEILKMMKAKDDDFIRGRLDELCSAVGRMNKNDLKKYLKPILRNMADGNCDEEEILEVYRNLEPAQFMFMIAQGYEEEKLCLSGSEEDEFMMMARLVAKGLAEEVGKPLSHFEANADEVSYKKVIEHVGMSPDEILEHENLEIKGKEASNLLKAVKAAVTQENQSAAAQEEREESKNAGFASGSARPINTVKQMDEYIDTLEQKLNSIGDDAQLANVDLQNALQKQQHTLQMMSNISKMLHDTSMAIIRKISA